MRKQFESRGPEYFKDFLFTIEQSLNNIQLPKSSIDEAYTTLSTLLLADLLDTFPTLKMQQTENRVNAESTYKLIESALRTAASTGKVIAKFLKGTSYKITTLDETRKLITPIVRDLLTINLNVIYIISNLSNAHYVGGIELTDGQLEIIGPSYLFTAKELSRSLQSESSIMAIQQMQNRIMGDVPDHETITFPLVRLMLSNDFYTTKLLFGAFINSIVNPEDTISSLYRKGAEFDSAIKELEAHLFFSFATGGSDMYLNGSNFVIKRIDSILVDCPLKEQIQYLSNKRALFPLPSDLSDIDRTVGCPAYFHNIAIAYVAKGLVASA